MSSRNCAVDSCKLPAFKLNYCVDHYRQHTTAGSANKDKEKEEAKIKPADPALLDALAKFPMKCRIDFEVCNNEFSVDFTKEELSSYFSSFLRYDENQTGELELFELNKMYEDMGETKTHTELKQIIKDANLTTRLATGVSYREFLTVILKDKKGQLKGPMSQFAVAMSKVHLVKPKVHDESKMTGKRANIFEQKIADLANSSSKTVEEQVRAELAAKRDPIKQAEMQLKKEQAENEAKEKKRKEDVARKLAKLQETISKGAQ